MNPRPALGILAAFVASLVLGLVALAAADPPPVGDEPHYLVIAKSLVGDADVDLADDYSGGLDRHIHAFEYQDGGPLAPVHGIGTSLLLSPFIAVRDTLHSARVGMVVLFAAFGAALLSLLRAVAGTGRRRLLLAAAVWVSVMVTLPVVVFAFEVFPDMPGALLVTLALRMLVAPRFRPLEALVVGLCAGFLPYLHVRFGIVAVPLVVAAVVRSGRTVRAAAPVVIPFAVLVGVLALLFWHMYGSPLPNAGYEVEPFVTANQFSWMKAYRFGLGSVIGWTTGLIPFAPLFWFGVVGLAWFRDQVGTRVLAAGAAMVGLYLLVVGGHGPVVNAFPGRTMIVFLPFLALGILGAVRASPVLAVGAVAAAIVSAGVSYQGVRNLILVLDVGEVRLPAARRLEPAFPWFSVPTGGTTLRYDAAYTADAAAGDSPGELARTTPVGLHPGMYDLSLALTATGTERVLDVKVVRSFDDMPVRGVERVGPRRGRAAGQRVRFSVPDLQQIQIVVTYTGAGAVRIDRMDVAPAGRGPLPISTANTDLPLTAVWIGMTAITISLIAPRRRPEDDGEGEGDDVAVVAQ